MNTFYNDFFLVYMKLNTTFCTPNTKFLWNIINLLEYSLKSFRQIFSIKYCAVSNSFHIIQCDGRVFCGLFNWRMWRFCGISFTLTSVSKSAPCNTGSNSKTNQILKNPKHYLVVTNILNYECML